MKRRTLKFGLLAATLALVIAQLAGAYWTGSGSGSGAASTATMPAGIAPTTSVAGTTVTVNVNQVSVAGNFIGAIGGGYVIKRYPAAGGSPATPGGSCASPLTGAAATLSCTDSPAPRGDWRYTASPYLAQWTSAESATSNTALVTPDPASALAATLAPAAAINLSWSAGAGATGYNVYRRLSSGAYNFGAPLNGSTPVGSTAFSDSSAISGSSYNYLVRSVVIGSAGQQIESANSNETATITADGTAPTGVTLGAVATPLRGTLAMTATASDTISGVASVAFQYKPSAGGTWTTSCTDPSAPYACNFDTTTVADGLYDLRVLSTDGAGNTTTSAAQTNRRIDNTPPTAVATDPGAFVRGTINLGGTGADAGSGIATLDLQGTAIPGSYGSVCTGTSSPLVCAYDTTVLADGSYAVRLVATDNAGNQTTSAEITPIVVDNTAPAVTMTSPGTNISGLRTLASTATDATSGVASVLYQYKLSSGSTWLTACTGSTTPFSCNFNTASAADNLYDFRAIATDNAGNQTTSGAVTNIRIDNTPPAGVTITAPPAQFRGTITINAGTPTDTGGSGVQSVAIQRSPAGAGIWNAICVDTTAPYSCSYDSTTDPDGLYDFRALATDNAGNTAASPASTNRRVDNTAPAVALTNPGSPLRASVALSATATDSGTGVSSVLFEYKLTASSTWTTISTDLTSPYTATWNTIGLNGSYDIRATATDALGNASSSTVSSLVVDNTAPTATGISIANGSGTVGRPDTGDVVTFTFSEAMQPASILAGWTGTSTAVRIRLTQGGTDRLTVRDSAGATQLPLGSTTMGTAWVTSTANFNATMTMTGNTITVTLGSQIDGTVVTSAATYAPVWTPSATATDVAGNPMSTATRTGANVRLF